MESWQSMLEGHVWRRKIKSLHACSSPSSWHLITSYTYEHWELSAFRSGHTQLQRPRSMGRNSESGLTTRAQLWTLIARESQERVHTWGWECVFTREWGVRVYGEWERGYAHECVCVWGPTWGSVCVWGDGTKRRRAPGGRGKRWNRMGSSGQHTMSSNPKEKEAFEKREVIKPRLLQWGCSFRDWCLNPGRRPDVIYCCWVSRAANLFRSRAICFSVSLIISTAVV